MILKTAQFGTLVAVCLLAVSCASESLQRRHFSAKNKWMAENTGSSYLQVDLTSTPSSKGIADAGRAQSSDGEKLEAQRVQVKPSRLPLSLVMSVERQWWANGNRTYWAGEETKVFRMPGDRLASLEIKLTLAPDSPAIMDSWDKCVTEYMTVDLGKSTASDTWGGKIAAAGKTTGEVTLPVPAPGMTNPGTSKVSSEFGPSGELNFQAKQEIIQNWSNRLVKFSGVLKHDSFRIRQEGAVGIDLSGNTTIGVELLLTNFEYAVVNAHRVIKEKQGSNDVVSLKKIAIQYPVLKNDITARLDYAFQYRKVTANAEYIPEGTHSVRFLFGEVRDGATLAPADITNLSGLVNKLCGKANQDKVSRFLWKQFSDSTRAKLIAFTTGSKEGTEVRNALVEELNRVIVGPVVISKQVQFCDTNLSVETKALLGQSIHGEGVARLNRLLLQDAYHGELARTDYASSLYPRVLVKKDALTPTLFSLKSKECPKCKKPTELRSGGELLRFENEQEAAHALALLAGIPTAAAFPQKVTLNCDCQATNRPTENDLLHLTIYRESVVNSDR